MKRHQTDTASLVFAVVFVGVVVWWAVARFTEISAPGFGLMVAGTLICAGVIGLASALRPRRNTPGPEPVVPTPGILEHGVAVVGAPRGEPPAAATVEGLSAFDVGRTLTDEERARADELIRQIDAQRRKDAAQRRKDAVQRPEEAVRPQEEAAPRRDDAVRRSGAGDVPYDGPGAAGGDDGPGEPPSPSGESGHTGGVDGDTGDDTGGDRPKEG